jgi:hypothetical protein
VAKDAAMTAHPTFTPGAMSPGDLDAITVGREALFDTLIHRISGAASDGARPHTLLIAPRGGGKTHTLHVVVNRSLADPKTAEHTLPVLIPEDSLAIASYLDLLVEIARTIGPDLGVAARGMRRDKDIVGIEQAIVAAAAGRMILLAIENLDRVFDDIGETGQGSLRAWVETSTAITIFATAPALFSGVSSRSYPWYGSFMVETLPELSIDDGAAMLSRAARGRGDVELAEFIDSPTGLERLQVIHRLAGGSPRLWHILSDCVDVDSLDALVPAVEALLDQLTPYYQHRLLELPAGEQRLVVELARGLEPRTVSDLAAAVGVSNQSAATALGRLASSRWVQSAKASDGDKRASWYDLTEPLLRYYLQYREERGKPLRLIVEFLRGFYSRERLMTELAGARPDSHLERHLQTALLRSDLFQSPDSDTSDFTMLVALLRVWIAGTDHALAKLATALESVAFAASGRMSERPIPSDLRQIIDGAVGAVGTTRGSAERRLQAGMDALATHAWPPEAADALIWVELLWGSHDFQDKLAKLQTSPAVTQRRTTDLAIDLRILLTRVLSSSSEKAAPREARETLDHLLDDIDDISRAPDQSTSGWRATAWTYWAQAVVNSPPSRRRRVGQPLEAGAGIVTAIQSGDITASDLPAVMAALHLDDVGLVAAQIALIAADVDLELPKSVDLMAYVDLEARREISRMIEQIDARPDR